MALSHVYFNNVGAFVAYYLVGVFLVVVAIEPHSVHTGTEISARIFATHTAEYSAGGGIYQISGVDVLIHAVNGIFGRIGGAGGCNCDDKW